MKSLRHITLAAIALAATACLTVTGKTIQAPKAYMFGFVASFNDSTVYFTEIQEVDSVWITGKKAFLAGRNHYSYQLRDYFSQQLDLPHRTCIVICDLKRKNVEKKYLKMRQQYSGKGKKNYDVRFLTPEEFHFKSVYMGDE